MTFITVQFDYGGNDSYARLLVALENSIKANVPGAKIESIRCQPPREHSVTRGMGSNTQKLNEWVKALKRLKDETEFCFIDCDMIVMRDVSDIWKRDFDVAVTRRSHSHYPYNGGVVFARNNERSIEFFELWAHINDKMFHNYQFHAPYRKKYAGMNQASFGYIKEKGGHNARMIDIPCQTWNCCNEDWGRMDETTRILHIKGSLRKACLNPQRIHPNMARLVNIWLQYSGDTVRAVENKIKTKRQCVNFRENKNIALGFIEAMTNPKP